jgi:hypothetical protein
MKRDRVAARVECTKGIINACRMLAGNMKARDKLRCLGSAVSSIRKNLSETVSHVILNWVIIRSNVKFFTHGDERLGSIKQGIP